MDASVKPPYRIPSMEEIRAVEPNGLTVASTFSGCGGSCLGFEMAGYRVGFASEFVPAAAETYRANHLGVPLSEKDIRDVTADEIREAVGGDVDVLEGSPPCASFSVAGKRSAHWGDVKSYSDVKQRTDDLFFEYARILRDLQPCAFVAENVSGLAKGVSKGYFKQIHAALVECGYNVRAQMLDAQWLGVPQARQRVIFIGFRYDLDLEPEFPVPLPYRYSIRDALPWLDGIEQGRSAVFGEGPRKTAGDRPAPTVTQAGIGAKNRYSALAVEAEELPTIEEYAIGDEWERLKPGESSDRYFNLVRPNPDRPVPTVTQTGGIRGAASVTHPSEKRKFTIAELRRLCGFPDNFVLTGSYSQQWERLGRSVPPPMMKEIALAVAATLNAPGGAAAVAPPGPPPPQANAPGEDHDARATRQRRPPSSRSTGATSSGRE